MTYAETLIDLKHKFITIKHCIETGRVFAGDECDWGKLIEEFPHVAADVLDQVSEK